MSRLSLAALVVVFYGALSLQATTFDETFDAPALDMDKWTAYPPAMWRLTDAHTIRALEDDKQHIAHVSTVGRFDVERLLLRLRVLHGQERNGYIRLDCYDGDQNSIQVMFRKEGFKVIYIEANEKPVELKWVARAFDPDAWHNLEIDVADRHSVILDGESLVALPESMSFHNTSVRVLVYRAGVDVDRIVVEGPERTAPTVRIGTPLAEINYSDPTKHRHYPDGIVEIGEPIDVDVSAAASLPAMSSWMIGEPDYSEREFTDQTKFASKQAVDFFVGRDQVTAVPTRLREFARKDTPEELCVYFNVPADGIYTFKPYFAGAKNLGNIVTIKVDGHMVYRDLLRAPNQKAIHSWFREHIPLKLKAGPHMVSIRAECQQARFMSYMMSVYFDAIGLEPGNVPLVFDVDASQPRPLGERSATVQGSRMLARDFHYRLRNLPPGELDLELLFYEAVTDEVGFRRFDVTAGDQVLLRDYDIVADIGSGKVGVKTFKTAADSQGLLNLHFKATVGRAQVNMVRVKQNGKTIVAVKCGASPDRSYGFLSPSDLHERDIPRRLPTDLFDGVSNVVANPGFEADVQEPAWRPIDTARAMLSRSPVDGTGTVAIDDTIAHSGKHALRLASTQGDWGVRANTFCIDWSKPYRFSAYVKGENATGETYLALQWLMPDGKRVEGERVHYRARGVGTARGNFTVGSTSTSSPLSGTFDWQQIHLDAQPPRGAGAVTIMIRSDNNAGTVWFDDLSLDGYGSRPVEVIATVGGYEAAGHKSAVVLSPQVIEAGVFSVVDEASGSVVYEGQLQHLGRYDWLGRYGYSADFSALTTHGRYIVRVTTRAGVSAQSQPVTIASTTYLDLARYMAFYFYVSRCGQEVPGWHKACHMDDAIVQSPYYDRASRIEPHRDLSGGWHDAGDYGKFNHRTWGPLFALASLSVDVAPKWQQYGGDVPDVVSEVMWGADYTCKIHEGNGLFISKVNGGFAGGHPAFAPSLETDGDPATVDGMGRTAAWFAMATPEPAMALASAARAVKPYDRDRAARYLDAAVTCYVNTTEYWDTNRGDQPLEWRDLFFDPKALLAALEIFCATGDAKYLEHATARVQRILPLLNNRTFTSDAYYGSLRWAKGSNNTFNYDFLIAPLMLLRRQPDHPLADDIRTACRKAIDEVILPAISTQRTPFGQMTNLSSPDLWHYQTAYNTELYPQTAYTLALAANVLDEPSYRAPAERNLQWLTGRNMYNVSYVSGIADRQATPWVGLIHVPGHEDGTIPGAIAKGINWADGAIDWRGGHRPVGFGMPAGFSWVNLDTGDGYQTHFPAMEIWEWFNYPTILAAIELRHAYSPDEKGDALAPMPIGSNNIIPNSGFEQVNDTAWIAANRAKWQVVGDEVPSDWDYNGDQYGILEIINNPAQARHGNRCLKITKTDTHRSAMLHGRQPFFEIKPGEVYWVSVWLRGRGEVQLWSHEYEGATAANYRYSRRLSRVPLQETWDRIDVPLRVTGQSPRGDVTHARFGFSLAPGGEVYVDDFEVRQMAQPRVPRPSAEK